MGLLTDSTAGFGALYVFAPVVLLVAYIGYSYLFNPLRHIPGPNITRISNIMKLRAGGAADFPNRNIAWHEQYGPLVRIGPDFVSVNDPAAFSQIYGFKQVFSKNPFYGVSEGWWKGKPFSTIITTQDEKYHNLLVRGSKSSYQTLSDPGMEARIQSLVDLLISKIDEQGQKPVDASALLGQFAFDAMGQTNMSTTLGFLESGTDVQNAMGAIDMANSYFSVIAQAPWMHKYLFGNRFAQKAMEGGNPMFNIGNAAVQKRIRGEQPDAGHDLLAHLLDIRAKSSNKLDDDQIMSVVVANLMAGYATVAITLRAITYYLCRNPAAYQRLQQELDNAVASGTLSQPPQYSEASKLPYLDAVVTETLRIHPPLGLPLGRVVPDSGVVLAGKHIPGGTVVGMNPFVIHRNTDVYGADAGTFRPERWLEADEKKLSEMKRYNISFGGGTRVCQGRDIALVEIKKVIPSLMRRYDFTLANPDKEWDVTGHWFAFQHKMDILFTPRKS